MPKNSFVMHVQKHGRMKYLLLTLIPPIVMLYFSLYFFEINEASNQVHIYLSLACMMILGYFLIFKKNHHIEVKGNKIIETDWRGHEVSRIQSSQVHSFKRNVLKEIILLDDNGHKLLCIEANMSNFQEFEQWLERHNIH